VLHHLSRCHRAVVSASPRGTAEAYRAQYLLEALVGIRFTVEEKNRIRRNLEGFKPVTISKLKPEFADFFALLMSFPNPKPRNIEKDVKVFPWRVLSPALKKMCVACLASGSEAKS
jgi:hypothetical protein